MNGQKERLMVLDVILAEASLPMKPNSSSRQWKKKRNKPRLRLTQACSRSITFIQTVSFIVSLFPLPSRPLKARATPAPVRLLGAPPSKAEGSRHHE